MRESIWFKILFLWFVLDWLFSLIIGMTSKDFSLFVFYSAWFVVFYLGFEVFDLKYYVLTVFLLAVVEETIVYYLGGGLQGKATSLLQDYVNALPVFFMFGLGWYLFLLKYELSKTTTFLLGGLHGVLVEIVFPGHIFNPLFILLFTGGVFMIYGGILIVPRFPRENQEKKKPGYLITVFAWILIFGFIIIGAIIADNIDKMMYY